MKNSLELGLIGNCQIGFHQYGRMFMPMMIIRKIRRIHGTPRICKQTKE